MNPNFNCHNAISIGVCYIGGLSKKGKPNEGQKLLKQHALKGGFGPSGRVEPTCET